MIELLQQLEELEQKHEASRVKLVDDNDKLKKVKLLRGDPRFEVDWEFTLHEVLTPQETLEEITREREENLNHLDQQMEPIKAPFIALSGDYILEREVKTAIWSRFEQLYSLGQLSEEAFIRLKKEQNELESRPNRDPSLRKGLILRGLLQVDQLVEESVEEVFEEPTEQELVTPDVADVQLAVVTPEETLDSVTTEVEVAPILTMERSKFLVTFKNGKQVSTDNEEQATVLECLAMSQTGQVITGEFISTKLGAKIYGKGMQDKIERIVREIGLPLDKVDLRTIHFINMDTPKNRHQYRVEEITQADRDKVKQNQAQHDLEAQLPFVPVPYQFRAAVRQRRGAHQDTGPTSPRLQRVFDQLFVEPVVPTNGVEHELAEPINIGAEPALHTQVPAQETTKNGNGQTVVERAKVAGTAPDTEDTEDDGFVETQETRGGRKVTLRRLENKVEELRSLVDVWIAKVKPKMPNGKLQLRNLTMVLGLEMMPIELLNEAQKKLIMRPKKAPSTQIAEVTIVDVVAALIWRTGVIPQPNSETRFKSNINDLRAIIADQLS